MLLAASTGGHLEQLVRLAPGLGASADSVWTTFRTPQSESLLAGRRVVYVDYIGPRDYLGVLRAIAPVRQLLRSERFDTVVSTGAALALAVVPMARAMGSATLYIESVARVTGPSLSGRAIALTRTAEVRTQHGSWAKGRWGHHPSVLTSYAAAPRPASDDPSLFVSLGTIGRYRFDALIDAVLATGLAGERTVWQLGNTPRQDLPGTVVGQLPVDEFRSLASRADVVISHAGAGTLLNLLDWGIHPLLVPRRSHRWEHVDDHQMQIAQLAGDLGVATVADVAELTATHITRAAALRTVSRAGADREIVVGESSSV